MVSLLGRLSRLDLRTALRAGIIGLVDVPLRLKTGKGAMAQYIALPVSLRKRDNASISDHSCCHFLARRPKPA